jgi:hypothetical protein
MAAAPHQPWPCARPLSTATTPAQPSTASVLTAVMTRTLSSSVGGVAAEAIKEGFDQMMESPSDSAVNGMFEFDRHGWPEGTVGDHWQSV